MLGGRSRERVDRLVVVADDAEVGARAEPPLEQPGLERFHVLVLVDGEGVEPLADDLRRLGVLVEELEGQPEHVLEVRRLVACCGARTLVDPQHELGRDRRLVPFSLQLGEPVRQDRPVLRPLDLARELAAGRNCAAAAGRSPARRSAAPCGRAPGSGSPVWLPESVQLLQRGRVERAGLDAVHAEPLQSPFQFPGAFSVNVTAMICEASNVPLRTWHAIRCVIVVVLPRAAPARIATGPRSARAASRCCSFSPRDVVQVAHRST